MTNQELLKIYSAYLHYAVDVLVDDGNGKYIDYITGIGYIDDVIFLDKTGDWYYDDVNDFTAKLVLKPLSDLRFCDMIDLKDVYDVGLTDSDSEMFREKDNSTNPLEWRYEDVQYLLSRHFDVFGLIDKNLAINLNKLQK